MCILTGTAISQDALELLSHFMRNHHEEEPARRIASRRLHLPHDLKDRRLLALVGFCLHKRDSHMLQAG